VITSQDVRSAAITAWYGDADQAPADTRTPEHPSRTRQWAQAWQHITTENVLAHRYAVVDDGTVRETVPFQLTAADGSPCWSMLETTAGTGPIWNGPVLYAGSPHAQYGGAGTATPALATATAQAGLALAAELDATAIVHPGLTTHQARRLRDAATRTARGEVLDLAITLTHTRPLGQTPDSWWRDIPRRYRNDARRHWRRGTEAGLTLTAHHGTELTPHAAAFAELANATAAKHTGGNPLYGTDMFHHLATVPGAVLLAARDQTGRLAGGFYGWLHHHRLYLWAAGIDPDHPAARHTYKWLTAEAAHWAIDDGATHLDLGRGNHHAKAKLGCHAQVLRTVVHLPRTQPTTTSALVRMSAHLGQQAARYLPPGVIW
jgi:CelD/BcsL family acetyltransferase involved in cellulose biosynthesis